MKELAFGVLLLAHGGDASWNADVEAVRASLDAKAPAETALGMADAASIQSAVDRLAARGARRVVVVPLFVSSASEVMEQTRWVLGLSAKPSKVFVEAMARMARHGHGHGHHAGGAGRLKTSLAVTMTPALDDHPLVAAILLERARALSREPQAETVVLVGHGPVDAKADAAWNAMAGRLAERLKRDGGFKAVVARTLRDDAAPPVRAEAVAALRQAVAEAEKGGRVLVVPHLLARGGIEKKVTAALDGLEYAWDGRTLLPHPSIAAWASQSVAAASPSPRSGR